MYVYEHHFRTPNKTQLYLFLFLSRRSQSTTTLLSPPKTAACGVKPGMHHIHSFHWKEPIGVIKLVV